MIQILKPWKILTCALAANFFGLNDFFLVKNWKEADLLKIKEKLGANLSKNATFQVTFWVLIWPARYKRIKTNIGAHKLSYLKLPSKSYLCYSEHTFWPWEQTDIMFGTDEVYFRILLMINTLPFQKMWMLKFLN